jgi:hypothetical protein
MLHHSMIKPILVLGLMTSCAEAQQATAPPSLKPIASPYKVAFWYEADHPSTSLKYQVYDLAKGEYDEKAVDRWLRAILENHPNHGAYVRDIHTWGEPGATEPERLASAIEHEKQRWADLCRQPSRPIPSWTSRLESAGLSGRSTGRASFDRPSPGSPGGFSNPPTSPFPYPYRSGPR